MEINHWTQELRSLYDLALAKFKAGERGADTFFDTTQTAVLASIGLKPINVYDYVEDFSNYGEPDWNTFLLVVSARRDYFLYEQDGQFTAKKIEAESLPPKTDAVEGIVWLPRILVKAQGFLEGSLCPEIMYGCGGDRKFFKEHSLHPADFARAVWGAKGDADKIIAFVRKDA